MSWIKTKKQTPHKYLEGFVSLYMIPIHGLGIFFLYKPFFHLISNLHLSADILFGQLLLLFVKLLAVLFIKRFLVFALGTITKRASHIRSSKMATAFGH